MHISRALFVLTLRLDNRARIQVSALLYWRGRRRVEAKLRRIGRCAIRQLELITPRPGSDWEYPVWGATTNLRLNVRNGWKPPQTRLAAPAVWKPVSGQCLEWVESGHSQATDGGDGYASEEDVGQAC